MMNTIGIKAAILIISFMAGWYVCSQFNEANKVAQAQAITKAVLDNDKLKNDLEVKKNEADNVVNYLMSHKPSIVRLPAPSCEVDPSSGGIQLHASRRILFEQTERILDSDRQRTQGIIGECESTLNSCRVVIDWARANQLPVE